MSQPLPGQHGRVVLITGANSGLGLCTARVLAGAGATVLLACRNPDRAEKARAAVARSATGAPPVTVTLDLADLDSVASAAEQVSDMVDHLDVLINNAGIMAVARAHTAQGFESQFGVNHLGHFALTGRLLPMLLAAPAPRVVTVSSTAHRIGKMYWDDLDAERSYHRWTRYGQSKLANLLFNAELARQAAEYSSSLVAVAAHPGYAATSLTTNGPAEGGTRKFMGLVTRVGDRLIAQSDEAGALGQIHAATAADVVNNDYWGPDGPFEQRGSGVQRVGRTARAADGDAAQKLWTVSEELTGVTYAWPETS